MKFRWFAPARVVKAPDGCEWEIYIYRLQPPSWQTTDHEPPPPALGGAALIFGIFDVFLTLIDDILLPLLRLLVTAPMALIRSAGSRQRRIVALTLWPHEERYVWEADAEDAALVADEVADALERGTFAQPAHAIFRGRQV